MKFCEVDLIHVDSCVDPRQFCAAVRVMQNWGESSLSCSGVKVSEPPGSKI